jgi:hypothetical protein
MQNAEGEAIQVAQGNPLRVFVPLGGPVEARCSHGCSEARTTARGRGLGSASLAFGGAPGLPWPSMGVWRAL